MTLKPEEIIDAKKAKKKKQGQTDDRTKVIGKKKHKMDRKLQLNTITINHVKNSILHAKTIIKK